MLERSVGSMRFQGARRLLDRLRALPPDMRSVVDQELTFLSRRKLMRIGDALRRVIRNRVDGDVVEFGVARGGSAMVLAGRAVASGRRFHGFDVFGMIPEPLSEHDDVRSRERYRAIRAGEAEGRGGEPYYGYLDDLQERVSRVFAERGLAVDGETVALHKGLFEATWPNAGVTRVAFAHVDCDWFDPVSYCLERLDETLSIGGAVVIDDFHDWRSCRLATEAFLERRPHYVCSDGPNVVLWRTR